MKERIIGVIAALAAGAGAGAAGAWPDPEQIAKFGPLIGGAILWAELRLLPLVRELIGQHKETRAELETHRKELAAARGGAKLELVGPQAT